MAYSKERIEEVFDKIYDCISKEKMSLRSALKLEGTPSSETFYKWILEDKIKAKRYAHACEARADSIFEEMLDIADDGTNDYMTLDDGREVLNSEHVQRSKLRIDARKWMLAKMNPTKYGDKIDVTTKNKALSDRPAFVFINKDIEQD